MRLTSDNFNDIHLRLFSFDAADLVYNALMNRFRFVAYNSLPFDDMNYRFFNIEQSGEFVLRVFECVHFDKEPYAYQVLSSKKHEWCKMYDETINYSDINFDFIKDTLTVWKWCIEDKFPNTKIIDVGKIDSVLRYWNDEATDEDFKLVGTPLNAFEHTILQKKIEALNKSTSQGHHYYLLTDVIKTYEEIKK